MKLYDLVVEVWDVSIVSKKYGRGPICPESREGYMEIDAHSDDIVHASFSPDGTALATVSLDGYIRFFQVGQISLQQINKFNEPSFVF